jgi:acetyltransferase-like isoleucine patch superfamily enzyme
MFEFIIKNPFTLWVNWLIDTALLKYKYRHKKLNIRYAATIKQTQIGYCTKFYDHAYVYNCTVGDFSYIGRHSVVSNCSIGKFCSIGPEFKCGIGRHPSQKFVSTSPVFYSNAGQLPLSFVTENYFDEYARVVIGNDVWIGSNVIVIDGVVIGDGAIIASGAVVTKDVEPYSIVGGIPAKHIRYRFTPEQISFLSDFKWWDKDIQWLKNHTKVLHDITSLMNNYNTYM